MVGLRLTTVTIVVGLLLAVSPALATASQSTNWAGYAVHRSGTSFHQIVGVWTEPSTTCRPGRQTFSSYWVGLGGYSTHSPALEQTGTEVDCTARGRVKTFAWFELVPAPSVKVRLRVPPGDLIRGAVTVAGHRVRVSLQDLTRHTEFSKILQARAVDVSSAEWIVEAPSECLFGGRCFTLPLANFGSAGFDGSMVQSTTGHTGSISDSSWGRTKIRLVPQNQGFVLAHPGLGAGGRAWPSNLQSGGSAFTVSYSPLARGSATTARGSLVATGRLVHRGL